MTSAPIKKLLVVDGDPEASRLIATWLKGEGVQVIAAMDGETGFMRFKKEHPDAVIISAQLDKVLGSVLCQRIKNNPATSDTMVIIASDRYLSHPELGERAVTMFGADAYLAKPLDRQHITVVLRPVLKDTALGKEIKEEKKTRFAANSKPEKTNGAAQPTAETKAGIENLPQPPVKESEAHKPPVHQGSLHDNPLPTLLIRLFELKRTGFLTLERNRIKREIYFRNGVIIYATSTLRTENPALMLVRDGIITEEEYSQSLVLMTEKGLDLNEAVVESTTLTFEALYEHVKKYVWEIIVNSFVWHEGHFEFSPENSLPENVPSFDYQFLKLIYDGVGKHYPLKLLSGPIHEHKEEYAARTSKFAELLDQLDLEPAKLKFALLIDGKSLVRDIVTLGHEDLYGTYLLLWVLQLAKMIEFSDDPRPVSDSDFHDKKPGQIAGGKPLPQDIQASIMREYYRVKSSNYFSVLQIPIEAKEEQIDKAFCDLESKFHPDNLAQYDLRQVHGKIQEIIEKGRAAHRVLMDQRTRREYRHYLEVQERQRARDEVIQAEIAFKEGEKALKKSEFDTARERFEAAIRMKPDEPDYYAYLGWALFQIAKEMPGSHAPGVVKKAKEQLGKAVSMNPDSDKAYLILGRLYAGEGNLKMAEEHFQKAIKVNPDCTPAKVALDLIQKGKQTAAAGAPDPDVGP